MQPRNVKDEGVQYAYATFKVDNVKEAGDAGQKRSFTGIASSITVDRMDDIVLPKGAIYQLPMPLLWQHKRNEPIGWVRVARIGKDEIEVDCEVHNETEPGKLKDRLDECWQTMRAGLVMGLSIGFNPKKWSYIDNSYGVEYQEWEWLELSAVTIPANPAAGITAIKSIREAARALRAGPELVIRKRAQPAASGPAPIPSPLLHEREFPGRVWPNVKRVLVPWA